MSRTLAEKGTIRDCLYRYCRVIDRADEVLLHSAYWHDAHDCHGACRGGIDGFLAQALPRMPAGARGVQKVSSCLIELFGTLAPMEGSFFELQTTAAATERATQLCGRYLDRFETRGDEWRVADRTVVYDWIEESTRAERGLSDGVLFGRRHPTGAPGSADPLNSFLTTVRARAAAAAVR